MIISLRNKNRADNYLCGIISINIIKFTIIIHIGMIVGHNKMIIMSSMIIKVHLAVGQVFK